MKWFKTGLEAKKALEQAELTAQLLKDKSAPKFWLKTNEEAQVIFVDDDGFWCERHVVKTGDRYTELTCKGGTEPCPICLKENKRPTGVTCFTVIDLRQYEKKDGTIAKYTKTLLLARRTLAKQIFDFKQKFGSLVGTRVILKRYTQQDPSCGIILDFIRDQKGTPKVYNIASLGKDYAVPFDYIKVLAPPTEEELRLLGYSLAVVGDIPLPDDEELEQQSSSPKVETELEDTLNMNVEVESDSLEDEFEDELEDEIEDEFGDVSLDALLEQDEDDKKHKKNTPKKKK